MSSAQQQRSRFGYPSGPSAPLRSFRACGFLSRRLLRQPFAALSRRPLERATSQQLSTRMHQVHSQYFRARIRRLVCKSEAHGKGERIQALVDRLANKHAWIRCPFSVGSKSDVRHPWGYYLEHFLRYYLEHLLFRFEACPCLGPFGASLFSACATLLVMPVMLLLYPISFAYLGSERDVRQTPVGLLLGALSGSKPARAWALLACRFSRPCGSLTSSFGADAAISST